MPEPASRLSDAALFERIARGQPGGAARAAKQQLYERHAGFLYAVLSRKAHRLLSLCSWTAEDLLQETFTRAFDRASSFQSGHELAEEHERRRTRAWLGRIAERLLADALRSTREVVSGPELEAVADQGPPSSGSSAAHLVRDAMEQLSERERDVLRVSALYLRIGERHQRLPNQVAAELGRRWGISNDNVRAIRHRALNKVRQYVQAAREASGGHP